MLPFSVTVAGSVHRRVGFKVLSRTFENCKCFYLACSYSCSCACVHDSACVFCKMSERSEARWVREQSDSLVVEDHVRQPDVFWGQSDLHHSIKLLRNPSQPIVLPLLRSNRNTVLSHSSVNHPAARRHPGAERRRCVCPSFCLHVSQRPMWHIKIHTCRGNILSSPCLHRTFNYKARTEQE